MFRKAILVMGTAMVIGAFFALGIADAAERAVQLEIPGCHT